MRNLKDDVTITPQGPPTPFAGGEDINNVSSNPVLVEFVMALSQGGTEPTGDSFHMGQWSGTPTVMQHVSLFDFTARALKVQLQLAGHVRWPITLIPLV